MYIITLLSLIPVVIWALMEPISFRFMDLGSTMTSIGQILGLIGTSLFSINLILAGRFKFIDRYFKGLDKVYHNHNNIGIIAFSLILFHPLFLVVKYLIISTQSAAMFFVPFINMPITWGIIALILMIIILGITFYIKLKYNVWKLSHKFMTVVFAFAILHTLFIYSDISRSNLLRYYILIFAFVGLIVSVRKAFFDKFLVKKFKYKIKNINYLTKDISEVEMETQAEKIIFKPGQFAFFQFIGESVSSESHPFSIASSNTDNNLKIIVKNLGDFTGGFKSLNVNDNVLVDGPYGYFSCKNFKNKNQIWIAGGIGVTPFLSMARSLDKEYKIDLYYSVKENEEAVCLNELQDFSKLNPNFKFNLWISSKMGYINSRVVSSLSKGLENKEILLCGPGTFMESLKDQFVSLGVDIKKIHYENFSL